MDIDKAKAEKEYLEVIISNTNEMISLLAQLMIKTIQTLILKKRGGESSLMVIQLEAMKKDLENEIVSLREKKLDLIEFMMAKKEGNEHV